MPPGTGTRAVRPLVWQGDLPRLGTLGHEQPSSTGLHAPVSCRRGPGTALPEKHEHGQEQDSEGEEGYQPAPPGPAEAKALLRLVQSKEGVDQLGCQGDGDAGGNGGLRSPLSAPLTWPLPWEVSGEVSTSPGKGPQASLGHPAADRKQPSTRR